METQIAPEKKKETKAKTDSLKGTFTAVLLLGAFIVVSWFAIFALFIHRG